MTLASCAPFDPPCAACGSDFGPCSRSPGAVAARSTGGAVRCAAEPPESARGAGPVASADHACAAGDRGGVGASGRGAAQADRRTGETPGRAREAARRGERARALDLQRGQGDPGTADGRLGRAGGRGAAGGGRADGAAGPRDGGSEHQGRLPAARSGSRVPTPRCVSAGGCA